MRLLIIACLCVGLSLADSPPIEDEGEGVDCSGPSWHGELGDNWPLAGISRKSKPKFRLLIKGLGVNSTYKAGKSHGVIIVVKRPKKKSSKRIHGFVLSQKAENSTMTSCGSGNFSVKKGKKVTPAAVKSGCDDLILDGSKDIIKTRGLKWKAPKCGCVTISVEIKSSDNMIFYDSDNPEIEDRYKILTKRVCPRA